MHCTNLGESSLPVFWYQTVFLSITSFSLLITHGMLGLLTKALRFLRDAESAIAFEHSFAQGLQTLPTAREEQHQHRPAAFVPTEFKSWPKCTEDYLSMSQTIKCLPAVNCYGCNRKRTAAGPSLRNIIKISAVDLKMTVNTWEKV